MTPFEVVKRQWFLFGIVVVILLAKLFPDIGAKGGWLKPEVTVKYIAVSVIFFNSGLSLRSEDLKKALLQIKVHVFIQGFTFILFPLAIQLIVHLLQAGPLDDLLLQGLRVLSCMPPPVSSAVILTKAVGGNEAAAIFNSAFGSFLGILVTPALILLTVGSAASVPISSIFLQLSMTVVVPIILGQIIRKNYRRQLEQKHIPFGDIGSGILLLIIYTTFCDTFSHKNIAIDGFSLFVIISFIVVLQSCLLVGIFFVATTGWIQYSPADITTLLFCSTHKSLTLGIPIIKIIFGSYEGMSVISLPLLIYHPTQILLGGLLVPSVRGWLIATQRLRYPSVMHSV